MGQYLSTDSSAAVDKAIIDPDPPTSTPASPQGLTPMCVVCNTRPAFQNYPTCGRTCRDKLKSMQQRRGANLDSDDDDDDDDDDSDSDDGKRGGARRTQKSRTLVPGMCLVCQTRPQYAKPNGQGMYPTCGLRCNAELDNYYMKTNSTPTKPSRVKTAPASPLTPAMMAALSLGKGTSSRRAPGGTPAPSSHRSSRAFSTPSGLPTAQVNFKLPGSKGKQPTSSHTLGRATSTRSLRDPRGRDETSLPYILKLDEDDDNFIRVAKHFIDDWLPESADSPPPRIREILQIVQDDELKNLFDNYRSNLRDTFDSNVSVSKRWIALRRCCMNNFFAIDSSSATGSSRRASKGGSNANQIRLAGGACNFNTRSTGQLQCNLCDILNENDYDSLRDDTVPGLNFVPTCGSSRMAQQYAETITDSKPAGSASSSKRRPIKAFILTKVVSAEEQSMDAKALGKAISRGRVLPHFVQYKLSKEEIDNAAGNGTASTPTTPVPAPGKDSSSSSASAPASPLLTPAAGSGGGGIGTNSTKSSRSTSTSSTSTSSTSTSTSKILQGPLLVSPSDAISPRFLVILA
ncbi:hypothetical protein FA15DRAFT_673464 [Coprinopsis marcescibilis]|uniref:Uncharacterized protein n=1 Tax=Coprinopsis marcescibilis TaxID=230819 RepID=A0A5C3KJW3_COPMA|nr:hypothetical protein FA15DRAFT_673464 [Coprinopsis marcescibilis]